MQDFFWQHDTGLVQYCLQHTLLVCLPVGFDGDGGKSERVRKAEREARHAAFETARSWGDKESHGERAECGQQQNSWQLTAWRLNDRRLPMAPEDESHAQRQYDPFGK